jgi:hypothetical protein
MTTSYNSVVFQTISANYVVFLEINAAFFTTRDFTTREELDIGLYDREYYHAIQDNLLNGQYLNTSRFQNISVTECTSRYTSPFIRAGNGFAVIQTVRSSSSYLNASFVLGTTEGPQAFEFGLDKFKLNDYSCEFITVCGCAPPLFTKTPQIA